VGQQPNIELEMADLPRPVPKPAPPRRWTPERPGDLGTPQDVPWGGGFGTIGPDSGYARTLVGSRELDLAEGEPRGRAAAAVAAIASARSSLFGRAPIGKDIDVGAVLLGYDTAELPPDVVRGLQTARMSWLAGVEHRPGALVDLVAAIDPETLREDAAAIRSRMAQGERLINR
jgi:hypothetical protein